MEIEGAKGRIRARVEELAALAGAPELASNFDEIVKRLPRPRRDKR